jgi:hypothetical protein
MVGHLIGWICVSGTVTGLSWRGGGGKREDDGSPQFASLSPSARPEARS